MDKTEALKNIIQEALDKSPRFAQRYDFWVVKRGRRPDSDWLFRNLKQALGEQRMKEFLEQLK